MAKRVAVVTDAVSDRFSFPYWYRYYGRLFGLKNLFVLTYRDKGALFARFQLGGVVELPVGYDEQLRKQSIGQFVALLLSCYDVVIRVDADEFLVVDPSVAPNLAAYVDGMSSPYLTARGFDVIQLPGEAPLEKHDGLPLLKGRGYAYPNTALNKTCIVTTPLKWSAGFHWANVFPRFGPLFMLHLKRIDIDWQMQSLQQMTADIKDNPRVDQATRDYYAPEESRVRSYHQAVGQRPRLSGVAAWYRDELIAGFLSELEFHAADGIYYGNYGHEHVLCEIFPEWKNLF
jgi:hypothetical protein